ncbi:spore germination protein [Fonticella tunisiensis]|uniref:Spore germination protein KA n=1 Tax=Fonticella tunisiensis TaxID=1096341 RepID=A0A4R7KAQ4_9CLOT|nr:spore germination protein [Fonticella tunisiensis]TDT51944.1 spore germination protein KA [Fonticella tunisiensis]
MFRKFIDKVKLTGLKNKAEHKDVNDKFLTNTKTLSKSISVNIGMFRDIFEGASDLVIRNFKIGDKNKIKVALIMIDGLIDISEVNNNLMKSLMSLNRDISKGNAATIVKESALSVANIKEAKTVEDSIDAILSGYALLLIDGSDIALKVSAPGWKSRSVSEPATETVVRGPKEGFVETLRTNIALIRRKIKNPNLKLEIIEIGKQTHTEVCIAYIKDLVEDKIVEEVRRRLSKIETDSILESGYIESLIEDAPLSIFPTIGNSEKPDIVSAKILEGRVAILVDGTPFVLTVPYLFVEAFQNSEDYYSRPFYATFIRLLRWLSFFISIYLPAMYVAVTTFHQELLPPALLTTIASAQEGTPFPTFVEALMMQIIYEILREAGVRLPKSVGQAVSIVGALVIGEAAVSAGLIGAPMVVIVALTAISSFVIPPMDNIISLTRLMLLILAGISGWFGIMLGTAGIITHICSLRSFGIPYTSSIAPLNISDMKDVFIRAPWWLMLTRPRVLGMNNPVRQSIGSIPFSLKKDKSKR